jgi:hypothetical protein
MLRQKKTDSPDPESTSSSTSNSSYPLTTSTSSLSSKQESPSPAPKARKTRSAIVNFAKKTVSRSSSGINNSIQQWIEQREKEQNTFKEEVDEFKDAKDLEDDELLSVASSVEMGDLTGDGIVQYLIKNGLLLGGEKVVMKTKVFRVLKTGFVFVFF